MKKRFFITGSGTGIGKTYVTAAMARQAKEAGLSVAAYKPLISGYDPAQPEESDSGILLQSLGLPLTPENIARVSPWRYEAPLAPSMAARLENRPLDFDALVAGTRKMMEGPEDVILMEGVGGVMVPLDDTHTVLDWIEALRMPVLFVAGTYLGVINHTLASLEVLKQRKIDVEAMIVNESEGASVSLEDTVDELRRFAKMKISIVRWQSKPGMAQDFSSLQKLVV